MNQDPDQFPLTSRLILCAISYAYLIENQFGPYLVPLPQGVYKDGETNPCINPTRLYYSSVQPVANGPRHLAPITDFQSVREAVVDESGSLVIPAFMMQDQAKYLSPVPTIPARGLMLIELLISKHIENICQHTKYGHYNRKIDSQILDECHAIHYDGLLERCIESLTTQVSDFIGRDDWHIYFTRRIGHDIMVEKTIDYRIYDWNRIQEAKNPRAA